MPPKYKHLAGFKPIGGIRYELTTSIIWRVGHKQGPEYIIPAGFPFDVSIPKRARWLFDPHNPIYFKAAAIHDHMLINDCKAVTAAAEFYSALKSSGVSRWRRWVMLFGVLYWTVR